jgi:threonyl-tRNA synthetase
MPILRAARACNRLSTIHGASYKSRSIGSIRPARFCSSHDAPKPLDTLKATPAADQAVEDHRTVGSKLNLFSTTSYSAGSPLFHPDGSHLLFKLQSLLRAQYAAFGFREVISPIIYKQSLWEKSGHWDNYSDDMFEVVGRGARGETEGKELGEDEKWGLKPMNCPGHCLLYATRQRSFRELPVRFADFSPLHRNEISGSLSGLTRVRRFHQDDGHIFCRPDQVREEIASTLKMIDLVYKAFGLRPHKLLLSTRPETSYIGSIEEWAQAETQLQEALDESGLNWSHNPGDGAFYGPKIDVILHDHNGKEHQTATIQLDFQLPRRFELEYTTSDQSADASSRHGVPILIHRAVLGSLERFLALLIEHYAGRWPLWLSPRQIAVIPINNSPSVIDYVNTLADDLSGSGTQHRDTLQPLDTPHYNVKIDASTDKLSLRLSKAYKELYNIVCLVGEKEVQQGTISVDLSKVVSGSTRYGDDAQGRVRALLAREGIDATNFKLLKLTQLQFRSLLDGLCRAWL